MTGPRHVAIFHDRFSMLRPSTLVPRKIMPCDVPAKSEQVHTTRSVQIPSHHSPELIRPPCACPQPVITALMKRKPEDPARPWEHQFGNRS